MTGLSTMTLWNAYNKAIFQGTYILGTKKDGGNHPKYIRCYRLSKKLKRVLAERIQQLETENKKLKEENEELRADIIQHRNLLEILDSNVPPLDEET